MSSIVLVASAITTLFLLFCSPVLVAAGFVLDTDGDLVWNRNKPYYILPAVSGGSGGLSWTPNNSSSCPLFVKPKSDSLDTPAFISTLILLLHVRTSTPTYISFYDTNAPCSKRLEWSVTSGEANDGQLYVTAGTSKPIYSGFMTIEEADIENKEYYIKHCRFNEFRLFGTSDTVECDDVGILENGLLGITPDKPVPFRFVKAFGDIRMPVKA